MQFNSVKVLFISLTFKKRASYIYRTGVPLPSRCLHFIYFFNKYKYWVF